MLQTGGKKNSPTAVLTARKLYVHASQNTICNPLEQQVTTKISQNSAAYIFLFIRIQM
jgi:hypothetical protein